jgi:hypothetical protein
MPSHQQITAAGLKAKRIRDYAIAFRNESIRIEQSVKQTLQAPIVIRRKSTPKTGHVVPVGRVA